MEKLPDAIGFDGQVVIVTGAGGALGRAYALDIAARGGRIVANDLNAGNRQGGGAQDVVDEIMAAGGVASASTDDISTCAGGRALVEAALARFGRVDAVVHNAGILRPALYEDLTDERLDAVMGVHLLGAFNVTRPAWGPMKARRYGRIVLTSSSAIFGNEAGANYAAAKSGMLGLCAALYREGEAHGIRVNCVLPYARSRINEDNPIPGPDSARNRAALAAMGERLAPRSVAPLVSYLASGACAVSGEAFSALAGRFARVALVLSDGWISDPATVTAEQVAANLEGIRALDGAAVPASLTEEVEGVLRRLRARGLAPD